MSPGRFRRTVKLAVLISAAVIAPVAPLSALAATIGGTPPTSVTVPNSYMFQPYTAGSGGKYFFVRNLPKWASFYSNNGTIRGTPAAADVGTYANISVGVSSGWHVNWLQPFAVTVKASSDGTPPGPPKISGTPPTAVEVGNVYTFQPSASDPGGAALTFSIASKPSWATFDPTTGRLTGTPQASNVGTQSNIVVSTSNGKASASLSPFSITVTAAPSTGTVTLNWQAPTLSTDGTALGNLAGYQIKYGTSPTALNQTIQVSNPGLTTYVVSNLQAGTYYFTEMAYTSTGSQSDLTPVISKTIN